MMVNTNSDLIHREHLIGVHDRPEYAIGGLLLIAEDKAVHCSHWLTIFFCSVINNKFS